MRIAALVLATLALAGCAVGGGKTSTVTVTVARTQTTPAGPLSETDDVTYFGVPVSIRRVNARRYLLVLRPEFFLVGVTANVVAAGFQHKTCAPLSCPGAEDDHVVVPAGKRRLVFVLPAATKGTVITLRGEKMRTTRITAAQLAALVGGAKRPRLIEPLLSGVWLHVDVATVTSFAQQFQP